MSKAFKSDVSTLQIVEINDKSAFDNIVSLVEFGCVLTLQYLNLNRYAHVPELSVSMP